MSFTTLSYFNSLLLYTFIFSTRPVNITIVGHSCSQTIRQKSAIVPGSGPYVMLVISSDLQYKMFYILPIMIIIQQMYQNVIIITICT